MDPFIYSSMANPKPSTPIERLVIVWTIIILTAALGAVCIYLGLTAPPAKAALAAQVRMIGYCLIGAAVAIWLLYRLVSWWIDRR